MRPTSPTPSRTCGRRGRPCRRRSSPTPRRSPGSTSASPATSCGIARPPPPVAAGRSTSAASEQPHDRCSRPVQVSRCLSDNRRYGLIVDPVVGGEEALGLARRLEPLHLPLSPSGRLMRILRPVVEALVPPMLDRGHHVCLCRVVTGELVG